MVATLLITLILLAARLFGEPLIKSYSPDHTDAIMRVVTVALIFSVAVFVDRLTRRFYWDGHLKKRHGRETPKLLQDLVTVVIVAVGLAVALWWQEGLTITGIAATSIGVAAAIGVALQADIQDVFSGLAMNYEDTCALGDWVTVDSQDLKTPIFGRVSGLSWRSTFLSLENGCRVSVPNHIFTSNAVINHSRPHGAKQLILEISTDMRVPSDRVIDMLLGEAFKAVRKPGLARTPEPDVLVKAIIPGATIYAVRFWYYPDQMMPDPAKSVVLQALQDVLLQSELPMPVTPIEMTEKPNIEFTLGAEEIQDGLANASLFRDALNPEQRALLASRSKAFELPRGTVLMKQGEAAASMYIVLEGAISITIESEASKQHEVAISAAGDVVGEMSLMTGAPRTATVTALTRVRVLEITKEAIEGLLTNTPELFERISRVLAQRQLENQSLANRQLSSEAIEDDILAKMKHFFSRTFGRAEAHPLSKRRSE
jgi:CRP-like cAMP-binding protein/small-conductance mechanosensitive channel